MISNLALPERNRKFCPVFKYVLLKHPVALVGAVCQASAESKNKTKENITCQSTTK